MTTTMKPILFNTEMVRAILDGRKTQTRRVVNDKVSLSLITLRHGNGLTTNDDEQYLKNDILLRSPYKANDILWVRETWCEAIMDRGTEQEKDIFLYKADEGREWTQPNDGFNFQWKPSIHMPKKCARIFLHVTNVRVERLQDIIVGDIAREGLPKNFKTDYRFNDYKKWFKDLWNSTAKDGYKWVDNPYVFVYEFEKASEATHLC